MMRILIIFICLQINVVHTFSILTTMKKNIQLLAIVFFLMVIWACQEKKEKFGTIDLDQTNKTEVLKFSQLADNIRYIPLETSPDFILSDNNIRLWVSDKYIIILSNKDIRQFTPEGKFIRKLASSGKGPDEYISIISYTVDEQNDILYYGHEGDSKSICAINLRNESPVNKINTGCLPWEMCIVDGNILCLPMKYSSEKKLNIFRMTPSGKITDSIPAPPSDKKDVSTTLLPGKGENRYTLYNDTIFRLDFPTPTAIAAIRLSDLLTRGSMSGSMYWIVLKNPDHFVIRKEKVEMSRTSQGSINSKITESAILLVDAHTWQTSRADKFNLDILDREYSGLPDLKVSGRKIFCTMSAFEIKNLAKEQREAGKTLSPALQQLDEQLTEESNPVIIVGDLK